MHKTFDDQRWTVEAYDDQGITVQARPAFWSASSHRWEKAQCADSPPPSLILGRWSQRIAVVALIL
jgi:hypothetical protein